LCHLTVPSEEAIGLLDFLTESDGIGGRIRKSIDDFVVEEILNDGRIVRVGSGLSRPPMNGGSGDYCHLAFEKRGVDLFEAIRRLSRAIGTSRKNFTYHGTKDAAAITCQLVSIKGVEPSKVPRLHGALAVHNPYAAGHPLELGGHWGNSFRIRIREIGLDGDETDERAGRIESEIRHMGGVPNFFGHQRFGTIRCNSHLVGRYMLEGEFESAVLEYLCSRYEGEQDDALESRRRLAEEGDFRSALGYFPRRLRYERLMIEHLSRNPNDYLGALRRLPRNLLSLFTRAFQAYLFNVALSHRLADPSAFLPSDGDVIDLDGDLRLVGADTSEADAIEAVKEGRAEVVYSIFGYASAKEGPLSRDIEEILEREGLTAADFYSRQLPDISPRGTYRRLLCPIDKLCIDRAMRGEDGTVLGLGFRLPKGSYATVVLREFMKAEISSY
jgi:tRNA pseudouridine13 synthase